MGEISHFSHDHPLSLSEAAGDDEGGICGLPILSSPSYSCTQIPRKLNYSHHIPGRRIWISQYDEFQIIHDSTDAMMNCKAVLSFPCSCFFNSVFYSVSTFLVSLEKLLCRRPLHLPRLLCHTTHHPLHLVFTNNNHTFCHPDYWITISFSIHTDLFDSIYFPDSPK